MFLQSNPRHAGRKPLGINEKFTDPSSESNMCIPLCLKGYTACGCMSWNRGKVFPINLNFLIHRIVFQSKSSQLNELFVDTAESKECFRIKNVFRIRMFRNQFQETPRKNFPNQNGDFHCFPFKGFSRNQIRELPKTHNKTLFLNALYMLLRTGFIENVHPCRKVGIPPFALPISSDCFGTSILYISAVRSQHSNARK